MKRIFTAMLLAWSGFAFSQTLTFPQIPVTPSVSLSGVNAIVSWSGSAPATYYEISYTKNGVIQPFVQVAPQSHVFTVSPGASYRFKVKACNQSDMNYDDGGTPIRQDPIYDPLPPSGPSLLCSMYSAESSTINVPRIPARPATPSVAFSGNTATISWSAVTYATDYQLVVKLNGSSTVVNSRVSGTSFAKSLLSGRQYTATLAACSSTGCSAATAPIGFFIRPPAPSLSLSTSGTSLTTSWTAPTGAVHYRIQQRVNGSWQSAINTLTARSRVFTGALGNSYQYRAQACNDGGCSPYSNTVSATLVPPAPALTVSDSGTTINTAWGVANGATSYRIQQYSGGSWQSIINTGTSRERAFTGSAGATYSYRAQACNAGGCSAFSAVKAITLAPTTGALPTVSLSGTSMSVSWAARTGATRYDIQQHINGTWQPVINTGTSLSRVFSGSYGASYGYKVRACNAGGCGAFSSTRAVTIAPTMPLLALETTAMTMTLSWTKPSGATSFDVQQSVAGDWLSAVNNGASTTKTFTGLAGTTYSYRVRACNGGGCSSYSSIRSATLLPSAPSISAVKETGAIVVSWTLISGATSYKVIEQINGEWQAEVVVGTNSIRFFADNFGAELAYKVRACNSGGCSGYSNIATITMPPAVPELEVTTAQLNMTAHWSTTAQATSYRLQQRVAEQWQTESTHNSAGSKSFEGTAGVSYGYRARACNAGGCSAYSDVVTIQIGVPTVTYIHTDILGSVIGESNSQGDVTKREHYTPFGQGKEQHDDN